MKISAVCAVLALGGPVAVSAQDLTIAPVPSWVLPIEAASDAPASGEALTILAYDMQTHFGKDVTETFQASRLRIETPEGLQIGNVALGWSPATSTLTVHELAIERDGTIIDVLGDGDTFRVVDAEPQLGQAMMYGIKTATSQVQGLRVGDTLHLAYSIAEADPLIGAIASDFLPRPELPVGRARFRYVWDKDVEARWRTVGDLGAAAPSKRDSRDLVLEVGKADYEEMPAAAPPRAVLTPRFELSAFEDWEAVTRLFDGVYEGAAQIEPGSDLAAESERIKKVSMDPRVRADLALDLVQDQVRYLFSALEVGGYAPASAQTVWEKRFGDCKGKTALLLALLRDLGIDAVPAFVSSSAGDALPDLFPTPRAFDHVIVRAHIGGKTYWLDGTEQGGAVADADLSGYRFALPVTLGRDELVPIEGLPTTKPIREVEIDVDAREGLGGPLPVTIEERLNGPFAQAVRLSVPLGQEQRERQLWFLFSDLDASFDWDEIEIDAPPTGAALVVAKGSVTLAKRGDSLARSYVVPGGELGWSPKGMQEEDEKRTLPWFHGQRGTSTFRTTIHLPVDDVFYLDGLNTETEAAGLSLSRQTTISDSKLVMDARWTAVTREIPAAEIGDAVSLLQKAYWNEPTFTANPDATAQKQSPAEQSSLATRQPTDFDGFYQRGGVYLESNRYQEAVDDYDAALALNPSSVSAKSDRAMALIWLDRTEEAERDLNAALAQDPENWVALHGLGVIHTQRGEFEAAVARLTEALDVKPSDDFARRWRVHAYQRADRIDDALADVDYLRRKWPADVSLIGMKVGLLLDAQRADDALAMIDDALTEKPSAWLHASRAEVLGKLERVDDALAAFDDAVALDGGSPGLWNQRCWFKGTHNLALTSALEDCERALSLAPDNPAFLDSRGLVHLRLGQLEKALADYDAALAKAPELPASLYGRGLVKAAMGNEDGARSDVRAARDASPAVEDEFKGYGLAARF
ncbi:tetratricopeptide repeat protein [Parvularcula dongshanensis]|uniref:Tetratricopeptide (TPR) repeat protein/transglutaminase-like putative cysteine protease n=1 Tax=Parvularcula dongshanensis TaxID=1173995 RepID=A0A840I5M8_9PROT|nr:tetratricopeptide repeat protein [Parvularcula dongshanensis]MBB4660256.1 tetratricopeptide (TPR) repeat protein/transglutaminase-like putative cysteine protease [Parvularcula dongshanensis]